MPRSLILPAAILPAAEADVVALSEHHPDRSDRAARELADAIADAVQRPETLPEGGVARPDLGADIRAVHLNRLWTTLDYAVSDAPGGPLVTVLRVLRQERDVAADVAQIGRQGGPPVEPSAQCPAGERLG